MRPGSVLRLNVVIPTIEGRLHGASQVLDVGGYDGSLSSALRTTGHRVTVVDLDYQGLVSARKRGLAVARCSAAALPFADNQFDAVLLLDVLNALPDDLETKALREARRTLRPAGFLCLTVVDRDLTLPFADMHRLWQSWRARPGYEAAERESLISAADLRVVEEQRFFGWPIRLCYSVFFVRNWPSRGYRLKKRLWQLAVRSERVWCPFPQARLLILQRAGHAKSG